MEDGSILPANDVQDVATSHPVDEIDSNLWEEEEEEEWDSDADLSVLLADDDRGWSDEKPSSKQQCPKTIDEEQCRLTSESVQQRLEPLKKTMQLLLKDPAIVTREPAAKLRHTIEMLGASEDMLWKLLHDDQAYTLPSPETAIRLQCDLDEVVSTRLFYEQCEQQLQQELALQQQQASLTWSYTPGRQEAVARRPYYSARPPVENPSRPKDSSGVSDPATVSTVEPEPHIQPLFESLSLDTGPPTQVQSSATSRALDVNNNNNTLYSRPCLPSPNATGLGLFSDPDKYASICKDAAKPNRDYAATPPLPHHRHMLKEQLRRQLQATKAKCPSADTGRLQEFLKETNHDVTSTNLTQLIRMEHEANKRLDAVRHASLPTLPRLSFAQLCSRTWKFWPGSSSADHVKLEKIEPRQVFGRTKDGFAVEFDFDGRLDACEMWVKGKLLYRVEWETKMHCKSCKVTFSGPSSFDAHLSDSATTVSDNPTVVTTSTTTSCPTKPSCSQSDGEMLAEPHIVYRLLPLSSSAPVACRTVQQ